MSYPKGTTLDKVQQFTKTHHILVLDESWPLNNLLYHNLGVNNSFNLAIKINLLQLKYSHISDILSFYVHFSEGLPHMLTS